MTRDGEDGTVTAACPAGGERGLTPGEIALVRQVFGEAVDCARVRLKRRRWFAFQPRGTLMAPCGHVHFHPASPHYRDDFAAAPLGLQALFLHEMTHVWQTQTHGWWYLPLVRPFSRRYDYVLKPGKALREYGIEQQAEIVRHGFLMRHDSPAADAGNQAPYERLLREITVV